MKIDSENVKTLDKSRQKACILHEFQFDIRQQKNDKSGKFSCRTFRLLRFLFVERFCRFVFSCNIENEFLGKVGDEILKKIFYNESRMKNFSLSKYLRKISPI